MRIGDARSYGLMAKARRIDLRVRQYEVARQAGVSRQFMTDLEHGKATLELGKVLRVFEVLDLAVELANFESTPAWTVPLRQGRVLAARRRRMSHRNERRKAVRRAKKAAVARATIIGLLRARCRSMTNRIDRVDDDIV